MVEVWRVELLLILFLGPAMSLDVPLSGPIHDIAKILS